MARENRLTANIARWDGFRDPKRGSRIVLGVGMNLEDMQALADAICEQYGIDPVRVEIANTWTARTYGRAYLRGNHGRLIRIAWFAAASRTAADATVRHEVAHWVAWDKYREDGHGFRWQTIAADLGINPKGNGLPSDPVVDALRRHAAATSPTAHHYQCAEGSCKWTYARRSRVITRRICSRHGEWISEVMEA